MSKRKATLRKRRGIERLKQCLKVDFRGPTTLRFIMDRSGAAAVEAAMILPIFIVAMFGLMEGSRALYTVFELDYAVYKTSRFAMVKSDATSNQIKENLNQELIFLKPEKLGTVAISETLNPDNTKTAVITAAYDFDFLFNMFGTTGITFNSEQTVLRF